MNIKQASKLNPAEFKRFFGVLPQTFKKMLEIVKDYEEKKLKSGRPSQLSLEHQVLMTLEYYRDYPTMFHLSKVWGVSESTVCRNVKKIEEVLIRSGKFSLPGKKKLLNNEARIDTVVIDATETPIQRPKKRQKRFYSGKKKRHTLKSQIVINGDNGEIIATAFSPGKIHDFRLFKKSKTSFLKEVKCLADRGYQGIQKIHKNSMIPKKKPRNGNLSKEDKKKNRELSSERIVIEHVNQKLKVFKILSERYRNRRKRFKLRFNLIAGFYNYELKLPSASDKQNL